MTAAALFFMAPQAAGKARPVIVTAPSDVVVRRVAFGDLDLASLAGEQGLNRRVGQR